MIVFLKRGSVGARLNLYQMSPKTALSPRKTRSSSTAKTSVKRPAPANDDSEEKIQDSKKAKSDTKALSLPALTLMNQSNEPVSIESLTRDSGVVLFLYPKANTPGCTKQACGFRDAFDTVSARILPSSLSRKTIKSMDYLVTLPSLWPIGKARYLFLF